MANVFPLNTYYMWDVVETLPTKSYRKGLHIGQRFLPAKEFGSYHVLWEEIQDFSPIAGFYSMTDLADPMHDLPWKSVQTDFLHSASRWVIKPQDLMFFRMPAQPAVSSQFYGTGPAANNFRERDAETVRRRTEQMVEAVDNLNEYMIIKALLGRLVWPPRDNQGNEIALVDRPVYWGRQALNMPYAFLAADAVNGHGSFNQAATTLAGVANGVTAQGIAWNVDTGVAATSANIIRDFSVIKSLMKKRKGLAAGGLHAIMSQEVLDWQTWNTNVLDWLLGRQRDVKFTTPEEVTQAVQSKWSGFTIETYDSQFEWVDPGDMNQNEPTIYMQEFMPIGNVLILPKPDYVGMGWLGYAPCPFLADSADLLQWTNGRYFWRDFQTKPPFRREMGMGQFAFPLMKNLDKRFLLDAWN